jgi:hypothetical protein
MPCTLVIYEPETKARQTRVCDEASAERLVSDDHAAKAVGEYTDVNGGKFSVDWTKNRLIGFARS